MGFFSQWRVMQWIALIGGIIAMMMGERAIELFTLSILCGGVDDILRRLDKI